MAQANVPKPVSAPEGVIADPATYSVYHVYYAGLRAESDYDEQHAIDAYCAMHPDADRADVERELRETIAGRRSPRDYVAGSIHH